LWHFAVSVISFGKMKDSTLIRLSSEKILCSTVHGSSFLEAFLKIPIIFRSILTIRTGKAALGRQIEQNYSFTLSSSSSWHSVTSGFFHIRSSATHPACSSISTSMATRTHCLLELFVFALRKMGKIVITADHPKADFSAY
jgi:hypothetical protein